MAVAGPCLAEDSLTVTIVPRDIWPPTPVTDLVGVTGAEGQLLLQWTAPDSNSDVFGARSPASGYEIRIATFSVDSVGGSTTAWWNSAMNVRALPAPAAGGSPPAPGQPGAVDSMLLTSLEPGATMYAAITSTDSVGLRSDADLKARTPAGQAFALVYDAVPPAPAGLAASQTGASTFTVTWTAVGAYDLDYYKIYTDSTAPLDFADAFITTAARSATSIDVGGLFVGSYAFRITAVDKGAPANLGIALESAPSAAVLSDLSPSLAQTPYGIGLSTGTGTATVSWLPVVRFAEGQPFAVPSAPTVDELTGYRVYRSTTPILADWLQLADVSTDTWAYTDLASGPQYYYMVRSEKKNTALSPPSLIRSAATFDGYALAPDDMSYLRIPKDLLGPLLGAAGDPASAYAITSSSRPEDLGGRVYKSLEFQAYRGGGALDPSFSFGGMATLYMHYAISGSSLAPSFMGPAAAPQNASVYWWNGTRWLQLFGKAQTLSQDMFLDTKYLGRYQIRSVERVASFSFNLAGLSNRFVTPNGDGKNDTVVFTFDNPHDARITGRVLDLRGRVVASDLGPGPVQNSLQWDGTSNGRGVPGGVYIYQLDGEGQSFTGTIVILK
jgi:hypothetical protein